MTIITKWFSWNAPLSKAVRMFDHHDYAFYGFTFGNLGIGVVVKWNRKSDA